MKLTTESPPAPRGREATAGYGRRLQATAVLLLLAGLACLPFDLPIAMWMRDHDLPRELHRLLTFAEIFAHGTGITLLIVALLAIDPALRSRPAWPGAIARMIAAILTTSACTTLLKSLVDRVRPRAADLGSLASAFGTFGTAALVDGRSDADVMSFPSGHAAAAAAFAAGLAWRYPRGATAFALCATLAAVQRVTSSAHYPSDVAFGAAVGLLAASVWLGATPARGHTRPDTLATNRMATSAPP